MESFYTSVNNQRLRSIPQVGTVLEHPAVKALCARFTHARVADAVRRVIDEHRATQLAGTDEASAPLTSEWIAERAAARLDGEDRLRLQRVVNATGIVIHTNLGRSPMAEEVIEAVGNAARHYSNLEFDLETGKRGHRASGAEQALRRLTGAESAAIVNNNAAAVMLALTVIAGEGGEVIVSRGELVEIGGSFRIPDVLGLSGAKLVEVGTTNRTHLRDYEQAITPNTRAILRVHASNYRIVGYTKSVALADLAQLAEKHNLVLIEDLGSGALIDLSSYGLLKEPTPQESLAAGAHLVTFSGDKLLGGPQAGMIVGRGDLVARMAQHPLYRALRADKMCLAALDATLYLYEMGAEAARENIPVLRMLTEKDAALLQRAERLTSLLAGIPRVAAAVEPGESFAGGGSLPEMGLATHLVRVDVAGLTANDLAERLRLNTPPVIGVISGDALRLDMRTAGEDEIALIADAIRSL